MVTILNFHHPLTNVQHEQLIQLVDADEMETLDIPTQFDHSVSFSDQVKTLLNDVNIPSKLWQMTSWLVIPPAFSPIAVTLIAEIHGRTGNFPTIARLRPIKDSTPQQYEIAELINLQQIRDAARKQRSNS